MLEKRWTAILGTAAVFFTLVIHFSSRPSELLKLAVYHCAPTLLSMAGPLDSDVYQQPWSKRDPEATPLITALSTGCFEVADQMVRDGMRLSGPFTDERIRSPLHWAVGARDDRALNWLLGQNLVLDGVDYNGDTALYESIIFGNRPAFKQLTKAGAKLLPEGVSLEKSPMLQVLVHPDEWWLKQAASQIDLGTLGLESWCPLVFWLSGVTERTLESVEMLVSRGATVGCRNQEELLVLEVAAEAQPLDVLHRVLKVHPPLRSVDRDRIDRVIRERGDADVIQLFRDWQGAL